MVLFYHSKAKTQYGYCSHKICGSFSFCIQKKEVKTIKLSIYKSYDDLPLFLNARTVANVLGVSISSAYELMHEPDFPTLKVGSRLAVPRDAFRQWAERKGGGAK